MALKKSLFSKPTWAAKTTSQVDDDQPIFGQNVYEDILEANRKREEKRLARQKEKEEKRAQQRKSESVDTKLEDEQAVKKRRISTPTQLDDDGDDIRSRSSESDAEESGRSVRSRSQRSDASHDRENGPVLRTTPKKKRRLAARLDSPSPAKGSRAVIPIDDEDEDDVIGKNAESSKDSQMQTSKSKPKAPPPPESESESEEEDEYIRELKRRAREEAKAKRLLTITTSSAQRQDTPLADNDGRSPSVALPGSVHSTNGPRADSDHGTPTPTAGPRDPSDTKAQILITTIMPDCSKLIVQRYASQPLDQVFNYWKKKNELDKRNLDDKVFFTWNGQKLYNSTTTRSILEQIRRKHGTKEDGSDLAEGKIEIEAVTKEIFDHRQRQKERIRAEAEGTYTDPDTAHAGNAAAPPEERPAVQQKPGVIIHLNSKDKNVLPFLNLRVRPDTTVQRIVGGYKRKVGVDLSRQIYLVFDGERLEDQTTVEEIGLEDEDVVEVME
ncbi:hypothetical protein H2198_005606 [Neophaeococcomyces mojaviensis]|uniref:Uncharacterized protein n=1 Tax=Neophaeococcomyces mojaviensis TaxID=3383035 RepID=A0ACC3A538_9EURO|nr:hypothetical protein H2198_005606 [Knufia sp. JES_112]